MNEMKQIGESELILNKDGSIYHLNLLPEDISDTIINVGDPDRVPLVSAFFDKIELKKQKREFVTHTGYFNGKRITVLSTGIGTDNIDIVYNELDALVNIDLNTRIIRDKQTALNLIRIGTSGALQPEIGVDSFICSEYGLGLDGLMQHYEFQNNEEELQLLSGINRSISIKNNLPVPYLFSADIQLFSKMSAHMQSGITASCQGFYGPQGRVLRLAPTYPQLLNDLQRFKMDEKKVTNFEMETGAMYGLARLLGHNCCSVNVIIANRVDKTFSKDSKRSVKKLIEQTLNILT